MIPSGRIRGGFTEEGCPSKFQTAGTAYIVVRMSGIVSCVCRKVGSLQLLEVEGSQVWRGRYHIPRGCVDRLNDLYPYAADESFSHCKDVHLMWGSF